MRSSHGAQRALLLSSLLAMSGLSVPAVTSAHAPECGRLIGSGITYGFPDNGYSYLASNAVDYAWSNSHYATIDGAALFATHDPWDATVVEDAIDVDHKAYSFAPADLADFPFSGYRVVVLNWDDTDAADFATEHNAVLNNLEDYLENGGVVWAQMAIQAAGDVGMPFGATVNRVGSESDVVVEPTHALVDGAPNPLLGDATSHVNFTDLPGGAQVLVRQGNSSGPAVLYTLRTCPEGFYRADGKIRKGGGSYVGSDVYNDDGSGQSKAGSAARGGTVTFSISIQNDGQFADRFDVQAAGSATSMYAVTYWKGTTNITSAIVAGTYRTASLAPGDSTVIKAKVKVKASATNGSTVTRLVTIFSVAEPRRLDAVLFKGSRS